MGLIMMIDSLALLFFKNFFFSSVHSAYIWAGSSARDKKKRKSISASEGGLV